MIPDWLPPKALAQPTPRRVKTRPLAWAEIFSSLLVWGASAGYAAFLFERQSVVSYALFLYAALFGCLWLCLLYEFHKEKRLVVEGTATQAVLIGGQEVFELFGRRYLNLTYYFYDDSGIRVAGRMSTRLSSEVHPKRLTVLYDGKNSARNVLYPPRYVIAVDG